MERHRGSLSVEELVFSVVSGDPLAERSLRNLCAELSARARCELLPEIVGSYGTMSERISLGSVHVAWAPPLVAEELTRRALASVVCCPRRPGGHAYHAAVFARAGSRIASVDDLGGLRAVWVDRASLSGCVLARRWCQRQGRDPDTLFAAQTYAGTHSAVARAVLGRGADVGATYLNIDPKSGRLLDAGWSEIGAAADDVCLIATIGPVPSDAIVISNRIPEPIRDSVADALCSLTGPAVAAVRALFRAERFERPPPGFVRALRDLSSG